MSDAEAAFLGWLHRQVREAEAGVRALEIGLSARIIRDRLRTYGLLAGLKRVRAEYIRRFGESDEDDL